MRKELYIGFLAILLILSSMSVFANDANIAKIQTEFISQTPDPANPGEYVDVRWRITNLGGAAADYTFELLPSYPFSIDESAKITSNSIVGYQSGVNGVVIFYKVRVDAKAVEGSNNVLRLAIYRTANPTVRTIIEQPIRIQSRQGLLDIGNIELSPSEIKAGTPFTISVDLKNLATNYISNVQIKIADVQGFSPYGSSNQKTITRIGGLSTQTVSFPYFVDANTQARVHTLPLIVTYTDSLGRDSSVESTIGVPVGAFAEYLPNLERTDIFTSGTKGNVVVSISNIGKSDINFVILELQENEAYEILSSKKMYLGNLESDDFETGQFTLFVKKTAASSVPLTFALQYKDAYDQLHTDTIVLENKIYSTAQAKQMQLISASGPGFGTIIFVLLVIGIGIYFWRRQKKK